MKNETETYQEMENRHAAEYNKLYKELEPLVFYAFGDDQYNEAIKKYKAAGGDENDIVYCGYQLYGAEPEIMKIYNLCKKHADEKKQAYKDRDFLKKAILHEMWNTEYAYAWDDTDVYDALDLDAEDITDEIQAIFKEARKEYIEKAI